MKNLDIISSRPAPMENFEPSEKVKEALALIMPRIAELKSTEAVAEVET
jgi:hypothetical protein